MTFFNRPWESLVRVFPPDEVTSINREAEVDPRSVGMEPGAVDAIWRSVTDLYQTGLQPAISLCIRRRGQVILDRAIGHERGNAPGAPADGPRTPIRHDSLFNLFSSSKAITAMLLHLMDQEHLIHLDDPVAEYIPEFAKHNKHWITIRHVLTHRAGIPNIPPEHANLDLLADPTRMMEILCDTEPVWIAGRRLGYHALTGGFILGEVVKRVTGKDIRDVLREKILTPLGMRHLNYGVPANEAGHVVENAFTGPPNVWPFTWFIKRVLGVSMEDAVTLSNDPRFFSVPIPSGNVIGTANEASRFYQMLLNEGELDGARIFQPRTVCRAVAEQSYLEADVTLMLPIRYGMGFILGAKRFSPYGYDTAHAFGHLGFTNVVTWADPEREISVALLTAGKPLISPWVYYWIKVMQRISRVTPKTGRPIGLAGRVLSDSPKSSVQSPKPR